MADLAESVFAALKGYVDRELGKLALKFNGELLALKREPGPPGEKGQPGESIKGEKGDPGARGEPGVSVKGDKGDPGESIKGEKGDPGASIKGDKGDPGESIKGEKGDPGASIKGDKGDPGESIKGEKGDPGASIKGEKGEPGISIRGEKGEPGIGIKGDKGDPGESIKGDRGEPGASAFQIAKAGGFVGSEAEWLLTLRAEDGARGEPGRPGRDALQIDLCAGIDPDRSYPARTFAAFNGGTFYAVRETDPLRGVDRPALAGWHVTQNGIQSDVETLEDGGRWRVRTLTLADGMISVQKQKTKMQIYRGVHQRGRAYDEGDAVTDFGCQWTALEDTKERPKARDPSGPQAWALTVKNGKDAREIREPREHDDRTPLQ